MKNRFRTLLSLTMIGILPHAMAAYEENELQWLDTNNGNSQKVDNNGTGTWTIGMNLNVSGLNAILKGPDSSYGDNGNALFTATGRGVTGVDENRSGEKAQSMTTTIGWGNEWYYDYHDGVVGELSPIGNAVNAGFQLGVATNATKAQNLNTENGLPNGIRDGWDAIGDYIELGALASGAYLNGQNDAFDVYRTDMKLQNGGVMENGSYDWSISETGKATATTMDELARMTQIDKATLFVVHSYAGGPEGQLKDSPHGDYANDEGNYKDNISYTTFYLTVIGKDKDKNEVVYNFMGQIDDDATYDAAEGAWRGGSDWYDVDMLDQITINNPGLVDSMVFVDHALTSADRAELMANGLPEPTTATLSLMALAALAARRRRR